MVRGTVDSQGVNFAVPGSEPLEDDQEIHVSEEESQEQDLRDELKDDLKSPLEVEGVSELEEDTHAHVDDGDYDRHFHLQVVDED